MQNFLPIICSSQLFYGITESEAQAMLHCLGARTATYDKGEYLLHAGTDSPALGLVLVGRVLVVQDGFWGGRSLLAVLGPGQCFAESFACVPNAVSSISVTADSSCTVLYLDAQRVLTQCPRQCSHHNLLARNLLADLAAKNLAFTEKMTHLGQRTTRGKLLSYLSAQAQKQGSDTFDLPFDRQQLADYLLVDRSGLCQELSRLRADGLLDFHKNHFHLKQISKVL